MKRDRDDTVKVAESYRKMQKMIKVKNELVWYALCQNIGRPIVVFACCKSTIFLKKAASLNV
jgi:hypothetical protein